MSEIAESFLDHHQSEKSFILGYAARIPMEKKNLKHTKNLFEENYEWREKKNRKNCELTTTSHIVDQSSETGLDLYYVCVAHRREMC